MEKVQVDEILDTLRREIDKLGKQHVTELRGYVEGKVAGMSLVHSKSLMTLAKDIGGRVSQLGSALRQHLPSFGKHKPEADTAHE